MCSEENLISSVSFRTMTEEDIEGVLAVDSRIVGNNRATTYYSLQSFLGGELGVSVVAESKGQIVAFLLGRITKSSDDYNDRAIASLEMIGVDPAYRRKGIGGKLVEFFLDRYQQKGVRLLRTIVSWHDWQLLSFLRSQKFHRGEMAEFVKPIE
jgi:ribosomal protein S18 acetylase RimI-like enzyme